MSETVKKVVLAYSGGLDAAVAFIERYVTNRLVGGGKRNASALSELRAATSITSQDEEPEDTDSIELEDGDVHTWETEGGLVTT